LKAQKGDQLRDRHDVARAEPVRAQLVDRRPARAAWVGGQQVGVAQNRGLTSRQRRAVGELLNRGNRLGGGL